MIEVQARFLLRRLFQRDYEMMDDDGKKAIRALVLGLDLIIVFFLLFLW